LPVGQDGFLAQVFARRYGSTVRAVRAIQATILDALEDTGNAAAQAALQSGSVLCQATGTELPLAQGPMTRVSDQARSPRRSPATAPCHSWLWHSADRSRVVPC